MKAKYLAPFAAVLLSLAVQPVHAQQGTLRPLSELIVPGDPGWAAAKSWIDAAKNKVEVLPADRNVAEDCLYQTQVTTRSPMGGIILHTGGLMVDDGWIRILGSGNAKLTRTLPGWNKGKMPPGDGGQPSALFVADDAAGGFFVLNGGALGKDPGKIYYLSPDHLEYEPMDMTYSEFLQFCFNGDLADFYREIRWEKWKRDMAAIAGDQAFNQYPPLWSREGKDPDKASRKAVPVSEQYSATLDAIRQLKGPQK